jgi:transcription initiation factor TFIID subunit 13
MSVKRSKMSSIDNKSIHHKEGEEFEGTINFTNELKGIMYGFGDVENPDHESVELLQEYVIEYIQNITYAAYRRNKRKGSNELSLRDLLYVLKKDKKRYYRIKNLIHFYENAKSIKKRNDPTQFQ